MAKSTVKFKDSVAEYERIAGRDRGAPVFGHLPADGRGELFHRRPRGAAGGDDSRRGVAGLQPDHRLRTRLRGGADHQPLPPDAHDGVVSGGDPQRGPAAQRARQTLALHPEAARPRPSSSICHKEKNADKRSAFYKGCAANGTVLESVRPRDYEIAAVVVSSSCRETGADVSTPRRCRC